MQVGLVEEHPAAVRLAGALDAHDLGTEVGPTLRLDVVDQTVEVVGAVITDTKGGGVIRTDTSSISTHAYPVDVIGNRGVVIGDDYMVPGSV